MVACWSKSKRLAQRHSILDFKHGLCSFFHCKSIYVDCIVQQEKQETDCLEKGKSKKLNWALALK